MERERRSWYAFGIPSRDIARMVEDFRVAGATGDLPEGAIVHVDGETGQVTIEAKESTS